MAFHWGRATKWWPFHYLGCFLTLDDMISYLIFTSTGRASLRTNGCTHPTMHIIDWDHSESLRITVFIHAENPPPQNILLQSINERGAKTKNRKQQKMITGTQIYSLHIIATLQASQQGASARRSALYTEAPRRSPLFRPARAPAASSRHRCHWACLPLPELRRVFQDVPPLIPSVLDCPVGAFLEQEEALGIRLRLWCCAWRHWGAPHILHHQLGARPQQSSPLLPSPEIFSRSSGTWCHRCANAFKIHRLGPPSSPHDTS